WRCWPGRCRCCTRLNSRYVCPELRRLGLFTATLTVARKNSKPFWVCFFTECRHCNISLANLFHQLITLSVPQKTTSQREQHKNHCCQSGQFAPLHLDPPFRLEFLRSRDFERFQQFLPSLGGKLQRFGVRHLVLGRGRGLANQTDGLLELIVQADEFRLLSNSTP